MTSIDKTRLGLIAVAVAAVLFVAANVVSNVWFANLRLDVTEDRVYTLSDEIKPVFADIAEPIIVRVYFSEALGAASPRHAVYYQRIRDLLQQYSTLAGGNLKVEYYDPEPFSDVEDRAVGFGLQAVPLGQSGEVGYFGLAATNSTDDQQVVPFFNLERERFLEYDLAKMIYALAKPEQPKIGMITSLPLEGGMSPGQFGMGGTPTPPWAIMDQIKELFDVENLDAALTEIPADIDILMLAQPENLSDSAQYAIDQFVMRGGKALMFVDPNAESANPMGGMAGGGSIDGARKLLSAWGVNLVTGKIVGDIQAATRVNTEVGGRPVVSDYVAWLSLDRTHLDPSDAITGDLGLMNLATAGALEPVEGAGTTVTPLIVTGAQSMRIDTDKVMGLPDVVALFRDFQPANKNEVLAARITGTAKSAFPDGPPKAEGEDAPPATPAEEPKEKPAHLTESTQPIQVVVVADADMLSDRFWAQESNFFGQRVLVPTADNPSFVVNALENLTGSPALSSLRGRGTQRRPFELVEAMQLEAERQYRAAEQGLLTRLEDLQKKVDDIQLKQQGDDGALLSAEDSTAIENYRSEILSTRRELREVQRALREDIDALESTVKFVNIGGVPLVFGLILVALAALRARRRSQRAVET
ncbi:MAG: Gldg family protein [Rhodospirillaceae bacterium]|nr:Gldg family protein [Rhodospirillaceae bacterium]